MGYNARNDEIRDKTLRECDASGKHNVTHKYAVGQVVYFQGTFGGAGSGRCEITRVLPIEKDNRLSYRIKSAAESFERTVEEHELRAE